MNSFNKKSITGIANSSLIKASGVYSLASLLNSAIPFLLLPILTHYLNPEEYGIISMFGLLQSIVGVFSGLSIYGAVQREYFHLNGNEYKEYVGNCIVILFLSTVLVTILIYLFSGFIEEISSIKKDLFWIIILISFYQFVILSLTSIYRAKMEAIKFSIFQIGLTIINVGLSILFVVALKLGYLGRIYAQLIAYILIGTLALIILIKNYSIIKINYEYIKRALSFGIPLIPHALGGFFITMTGRLIISHELGLEQAGLYALGTQLGSIIGILADSFNKAYSPWLYEKLNKNDNRTKRKIVKFTYLYFILIIVASVILGLSSPFVINIIAGKQYHNAYNVVMWIALGNAFNGMYFMVTNYIFYAYKTHILAIITIITGIINIFLTFFMVKYMKLVGAALSFMIVNAISFILTWYLSSRLYKMPWKIKEI